jgi:O-succinylbenzoic acid--CoA ligase
VLASGYRLRPDLDGVTFIEGRLMTEDAGRLDEAGLLHVLGRLDDVVIVGGVNVALSAVEAAIRHHPNIADVAVVDYPDDLWGSLPVAYLVTRGQVPNLSALLDELRDVVASRIGRAATPRSFNVVTSLPLLDSGKVDRFGIRIQAAKDIASGAMPHPGSR